MRTKDHNLILRPGGYSCRVQRDGKEHWQSLDTDVLTVARARRDKLLEEIRGQRWAAVEALRARPEVSDLESVATAYLAWAAGAKLRPITARSNVRALRRIVRATLGKELRDVRADALTPAMLADYQARAIEAARPFGPGALNRALNSTHSNARQARSLFAARPMQRGAYRDMHLPDLAPWLAYSLDHGKIAKPVPASAALLARTRQVARAMRTRKPAHWIALMLAANLGLRRGEILAAQWEWVTVSAAPDGGRTVYVRVGGTEDYESKGTRRVLQIAPALWEQILDARQDASPHMIPGTIDDRENVMRKLALILRATGWKQRKPLHELRRNFGMQVAHVHGILAAKDQLGHTSLATTNLFYVSSMKNQTVSVL